VSATADLLSNYQHVIDELSLEMGGSGIFDVVVNDSLIYSKDATGRHAEPGEVLGLFKELVGPDVPIYGT
jgi:selenoprotein W-related protein